MPRKLEYDKLYGSYIEFFGAEDAGKVRGPGRDILYINEANLLPHSIYQQLALRTKQTIFLDFNHKNPCQISLVCYNLPLFEF